MLTIKLLSSYLNNILIIIYLIKDSLQIKLELKIVKQVRGSTFASQQTF